MQAPSLSVLLGEAGVKDKSDAGSVHDVKAFMLSNLVNAPYSRIDTKDYAEGIPDVIGTVFQLTEESTLQSYKQKFKLEGLHSGDFARQQVIFVNPCAMEKEVLVIDEEAIYEELMALGEWCVFGESALFSKQVGKKLHTGCCLEPTHKENRVNFVLTNEAETLRKKMYIEEHLLRTKLENFETNEWSMQSRFNAKVLTEALQYAQTEYSYAIKNNADAAPVITLEMLQNAFKFVTESDRGFKANFDLFNAKAELVLEALVNHLDKKFKGKKMVLHREIVAGNSTFNRIVKREATEREPYSKLVTQAYEMGDDLGYWVHLNKNSTLIKRQEHGAGSGGGVILVLKTVR
jgi:hypothetical protein